MTTYKKTVYLNEFLKVTLYDDCTNPIQGGRQYYSIWVVFNTRNSKYYSTRQCVCYIISISRIPKPVCLQDDFTGVISHSLNGW